MKLKEIMKHIPVYQYFRLEENLSIVAGGYTKSADIQKYENKTIGSIRIQSGTLTISVYSR
ncbi:hypothetical protein [uncultured Dysosmobacter sp.]|uniref:hypothetical protein n=1 Tax=uncultured Dysosmobacter sp. TaxID=2591384 RepID=UPI002605E842|nr:hypothetical protein [uncultured Dysosmobacter sp.]